jgi:hypothetical protein
LSPSLSYLVFNKLKKNYDLLGVHTTWVNWTHGSMTQWEHGGWVRRATWSDITL